MLKRISPVLKALPALMIAIAMILLAACGTNPHVTTESEGDGTSGSELTEKTETAAHGTETAVSQTESTATEDTSSASSSVWDPSTETETENTETVTASETTLTETVPTENTETETSASETTETETSAPDDPFGPGGETPTVSFSGVYGKVTLKLMSLSHNPALFACQFGLAAKVVDDFENVAADRAEGRAHIYSSDDERTSFIIDVAYYDSDGGLLFVKLFACTYSDDGDDLCAPIRVLLNGCDSFTKRRIAAACLSAAVSSEEDAGKVVDDAEKARLASLITLTVFLAEDGEVCFFNPVDDGGSYVVTRIPVSQIEEWKNEKVIALTYDDGPAGNTDFVLDLLEKEGVKATFFVQGYRLVNDTAASRLLRMKSLGCEIGNHSYDHKYFNKLTDEEVYYQISETNRLIKEITGDDCTLLRPPGGYEYSSTQADTMYEKYGIQMHIMIWWVDSRDWDYNINQSMTAEQKIQSIVNTVMGELRADDGHYKSGFIVLLHDVHGVTYYATQQLIPTLKALGYKFVTVSELMGYDIDDCTVYDYSAFNYGRGITQRYK